MILTTVSVLDLSRLMHSVLPMYTSQGYCFLSVAPEKVLIDTKHSSMSLLGEEIPGGGYILQRLAAAQLSEGEIR